MAEGMKLRAVNKALTAQGCEKVSGKGRGPHVKWRCPCGKHTALIPRHTTISPGVIKDTIDRMGCLQEGWLQ